VGVGVGKVGVQRKPGDRRIVVRPFDAIAAARIAGRRDPVVAVKGKLRTDVEEPERQFVLQVRDDGCTGADLGPVGFDQWGDLGDRLT